MRLVAEPGFAQHAEQFAHACQSGTSLLADLFECLGDCGCIRLGPFLFRVFDILKPWPVSWADRHVGGGVGIMLDDLLAGVYAALAMAAIHGLIG